MTTLERFSISLDRRLLRQFDARNRVRGYSNRSEAIRDLIRRCLVEEQWQADESGKMAATVTLVYDHHRGDLMHALTHLQHEYGKIVVASTHVHLDNDNCLEVIILRGPGGAIRRLADGLIAMKGVKHGKAVFTTEGKDLW
ncbi:MAG: nickel-responsive transcriptional regulator NikR [Candidatus Sumerlaeia bacterium]